MQIVSRPFFVEEKWPQVLIYMYMRGIILAGGTGTRLEPLTKVTNKHLLPVYDRPMIDWAIGHLEEIGIKDIGIVISEPHDEAVKRYLGSQYTYLHQGKATGIGRAALSARSFIGDSPFVVHLGDQVYTESLKEHYDAWIKNDSQIHIILRWYEHANRHTVVFVEEGRVVSLIEKPQQPNEGYVMVGMSFYKPDIFEVLEDLSPGYAGEYQLSDAISLALKRKFSVTYSILSGEWVDAGTPDNLLQAAVLMHRTFLIR